MSTKHTPGPWRACAGGQIVAGPMSRQVARVWNTKNREYDTANANLIAAAPDLLAALEELADLVDDIVWGNYKPDSFTTQPARAAIAKATGGNL